MSPELFYPENFGLTDSRPTKRSDCYALGMVIYEVLSGRVPFPRHTTCAVVAKVSRGERPGRPRGAERKLFTDNVWRMLQRCWAPKRDHRPKIDDVLRCLEEASRFWTPLSPRKVEDPSIANSSTRNSSESTTEGSTEDSGASSPSHAAMPKLSPLAHPFGKSAETPVHGSTDHEVGMGDELIDGPLGQIDSASQSSLSDLDETANVNTGTFTSGPTLTFSGPSSSHKYAITELPSRTYYPTATLKPNSIPAPATSKQQVGGKSRPRARTQPTSQQSNSLLQPQPIRPAFALFPTIIEPLSPTHECNTGTSAVGPVVPPKPTRVPTPAISKQRGVMRSPHGSLPRDHTQPTSPWQSDLSLQTAPSKSLTFVSTFVEPPSSSYGYDTPLQTPHAKSLALSSTLAEPSSSPLQYDTDSSFSTYYPIVPPKPVNFPASATSKQRGVKPLLRGVLRDHTQLISPRQRNLPPQPPPAKPLALSSTGAEPPSSYHEYDTDTSSSNYSFVILPMPVGIPTGHSISKQGGGRKSRRSGPLRNCTLFAVPWRSRHFKRHNTPATSPFSPYPEPQVLSMDGVIEAVSYGDTGGLPTSQARRRRFGNRTWKNWLRSSLGKLFGNPVTPS